MSLPEWVALGAVVWAVLIPAIAQVETANDGDSSAVPSMEAGQEPLDGDQILKAQLDLLKQGKINKRRLIVRLKDNPTARAAGADGIFDPFKKAEEMGPEREDGDAAVAVLSAPEASTTTITKSYSGPGFRATTSITVRKRAFSEVQKVRKEGKKSMEAFLDKYNLTNMQHFWYGARSGVSVLDLEDEGKLEELWAKLRELKTSGVLDFVEPDLKLTTFQSRRGCTTISDWGFRQTRTPQALELLGSNDGQVPEDAQVLVAVIDSGIDLDHPSLRDHIFVNQEELNGLDGVDDDQNGFVDDIRGWNFRDGTNNTQDNNGHGSHVSGILAAAPSSNPEFQGIAPNARILPCKFAGPDQEGSVSDAVRCFEYAWLMGAEMTSNSWGGPMAITNSLALAVQNAQQADVLTVFAAGNDGVDNDGSFFERTFPASLENEIIVAVAAIDAKGSLLEQSNFGSESVDIGAPGGSVLSTGLDGGFLRMSGTSMATPFVTGAAALLLGACKQQRMPCTSAAAIKRALLSGASVTGQLNDQVMSNGHLDISRAVELLDLNVNVSSSPEVPLTVCGEASALGGQLAPVLVLLFLFVLWL